MQRADAIFEAKMALEEELARPLLEALAGYVTTWAATDGRPSLMQRVEHQDIIEAVLARHYARVVLVMTGRAPTGGESIDDVKLSLAHGERLRARSHKSAMRLMASIDRDLASTFLEVESGRKADDDVLELKEDAPLTMSFRGKLLETAKRVVEKVRRRSKTVANVETQEPAEQALVEWVEKGQHNARLRKYWETMGDERVRPAHEDAEGQSRWMHEPFEVGGELLRHPGDQGLGASLGNVINCRCTLKFTIVADDGREVPLPLDFPQLPARRPWREGDDFGIEIPIRPTELVTLNGRTVARIVLGDGKTQATLRQRSPSLITVHVRGKPAARATIKDGRVDKIHVAPGYGKLGIADLIRRSVEHSAARARQ